MPIAAPRPKSPTMSVFIAARFAASFAQPTSVLLQFEAAETQGQRVVHSAVRIAPEHALNRVVAQDGIGSRIWLLANGRLEVQYEAHVEPQRQVAALDQLTALPPHELPGEAVPYLLDSRYCRADEYQGLAAAEFSGSEGGARIGAIRDWIHDHFTYRPGVSDASTDATQSFIAREGVCRDYAHVLVMLARASGIPARYVACYAPGVTPQDFHAVAEVYLADSQGGAWRLVDATGMADLAQAVRIGVGRDAADVSFVTSFGPMQFEYSKVDVTLAG